MGASPPLATPCFFKTRHLTMRGYETPERGLPRSPIRTIRNAVLAEARETRSGTKTMLLRIPFVLLGHIDDQITHWRSPASATLSCHAALVWFSALFGGHCYFSESVDVSEACAVPEPVRRCCARFLQGAVCAQLSPSPRPSSAGPLATSRRSSGASRRRERRTPHSRTRRIHSCPMERHSRA